MIYTFYKKPELQPTMSGSRKLNCFGRRLNFDIEAGEFVRLSALRFLSERPPCWDLLAGLDSWL